MQVSNRVVVTIERSRVEAANSAQEIEDVKQEALIEVGKFLLQQGLSFEELEQIEFEFKFASPDLDP
jgi:hypothetical protein